MNEREIHIFEKKVYNVPEGDDRVEWTKGDLVVTCHNCGEEQTLSKSIETGIQVILPVNNWHEVRLSCDKCNSSMSLHFTKADDGEIKEKPEEVEDEETDGKVIDMKPTQAETDPDNDRVFDTEEEISAESAMTNEVANELIDEPTEESTEA